MIARQTYVLTNNEHQVIECPLCEFAIFYRDFFSDHRCANCDSKLHEQQEDSK